MLRPPPPPYAVAEPLFRFPALARLVGRLPTGAGREAALATLLAARLAESARDEIRGGAAFNAGARTARASAAAHWFTVACPDSRVRAACIAVAEASAQSRGDAVARAVQRVIDTAAAYLDADARAELTTLARGLTGGDGPE